MMKRTKSPKELLRQAYEVGKRELTSHTIAFGPSKFTQPQLFACLIFKAFFRFDYELTEQILLEHREWREVIGLTEVPHFTTLQKAENLLLNQPSTEKLLVETIRAALTPTQMRDLVRLATIDGSGFEARHVGNRPRRKQDKLRSTPIRDV